MIIGIMGNIGSGKGKVSEYIQEKYNFQKLSFANSLKSAVSSVFDWPLELLQGSTPESREWRETVDQWWSERLHIKGLTPRWILQQWGTEVCRYGFHPDIWVASLEHRIMKLNNNIVIDDCRFINEMESIRKYNGILIKVTRGELPEWYNTALDEVRYLKTYGYETGFESMMAIKYPDVHISEWGWIDEKFDYDIENNGTVEELNNKIDNIIKNITI